MGRKSTEQPEGPRQPHSGIPRTPEPLPSKRTYEQPWRPDTEYVADDHAPDSHNKPKDRVAEAEKVLGDAREYAHNARQERLNWKRESTARSRQLSKRIKAAKGCELEAALEEMEEWTATRKLRNSQIRKRIKDSELAIQEQERRVAYEKQDREFWG